MLYHFAISVNILFFLWNDVNLELDCWLFDLFNVRGGAKV